MLDAARKGVLALRYDCAGRTLRVLTISPANRRRRGSTSTAPRTGGAGRPLRRRELELRRDGTLELALEGYGLRWLRARKAGASMVLYEAVRR